MRKLLPVSFFDRPTRRVAEELIGKFLVRRTGKREIAAMITETEAYDGLHDKASHASRGKTKRNEPMFGSPGHWYVYLCYGVHEMLNIVTGEHGYPAAVLIRGASVQRPAFREENIQPVVLNGPGKLTRFLNIGRPLNSKPSSLTTGLWIEDRGVTIPKSHIKKMPRVGVAYAGEYWMNKKWRFVVRR
jgi:DNA-3-methyladenine glycosylase